MCVIVKIQGELRSKRECPGAHWAFSLFGFIASWFNYLTKSSMSIKMLHWTLCLANEHGDSVELRFTKRFPFLRGSTPALFGFL